MGFTRPDAIHLSERLGHTESGVVTAERCVVQGLLGMCPGEMRHVLVPPAMAYGEGGHVPAHATLFLALELVELHKPGLKIEVITSGSPTLGLQYGATVTLRYSAFIVPAQEFFTWNSKSHKELVEQSDVVVLEPEADWGPFIFDHTTDLIKGLRYGLLGMCHGERRRLLIQPELGWPGGIHGYIGANQTVLFMMELAKIELPTRTASTRVPGRKAEL